LDEVGATDERVRRLRTIPGVGPRTAEAVVAYLGDAGRFPSGKEVSAYAGLVPSQYQSGEGDRRGRITKPRPGPLRKLLVGSACPAPLQRLGPRAVPPAHPRRGAQEAGGGGPGQEAAGPLLGDVARRHRLAGTAGPGRRGRISDLRSGSNKSAGRGPRGTPE